MTAFLRLLRAPCRGADSQLSAGRARAAYHFAPRTIGDGLLAQEGIAQRHFSLVAGKKCDHSSARNQPIAFEMGKAPLDEVESSPHKRVMVSP